MVVAEPVQDLLVAPRADGQDVDVVAAERLRQRSSSLFV
jgi:hypothetical protein